MSESRLEYLRDFGYTADTVYPYAKVEVLKARLLEVGGVAVILVPKAEYRQLLKDGEFRDGAEARVWKQRVGDCHGNVARTMGRYRAKGKPDRFVPMTGFALSDDGAWRYHSWLVESDTNKIVETTRSRLAYYGVTDREV